MLGLVYWNVMSSTSGAFELSPSVYAAGVEASSTKYGDFVVSDEASVAAGAAGVSPCVNVFILWISATLTVLFVIDASTSVVGDENA